MTALPEAVRRAFIGSRVLVLAAATLGAIAFPAGIGAAASDPALVHPFGSWPAGGVLDFFLSPLARWDGLWYLRIAEHGYRTHVESQRAAQAFFPGYPLAVRGLGGFLGAGAALIVAQLVSLASLLGALTLLHRLVRLELGRRIADASVALLAFSPFAFYFSAPYTESLFLLLSVGAIYAARTDRWALAGLAAAGASATRLTGVVLILPLAIMYLYGPRAVARPRGRARFPLRPNALWLALAPLGVVAFSAWEKHAVNNALAWRDVQSLFGHQGTHPPTETIRRAAVAAWHALEGTGPHVYRTPILIESATLIVAVVAVVGVFRLLPAAYGAYSLAALLASIASPVYLEPLRSLPRYLLPVFPLTVWLAALAERRGWTPRLLIASAAALAFLTAAFASWQPYV